MKSANRGAGNRSLLNGGKGDADRTTDVQSFRRNFDEINFPYAPVGFHNTARGERKVYYGKRFFSGAQAGL